MLGPQVVRLPVALVQADFVELDVEDVMHECSIRVRMHDHRIQVIVAVWKYQREGWVVRAQLESF